MLFSSDSKKPAGKPICQLLTLLAMLLIAIAAVAQTTDRLLQAPTSHALQQVRTLITANVLELAEKILEQQGPPILPNGDWLNWERQLWALYRITGKWQRLYARAQSIPPAFPAVVRHEAKLEAIKALIALHDGKRARKLIRKQLLSDTLSERDKIAVRRNVIASYVADNLLPEAGEAAVSFQSDYRPKDQGWLLLSAHIALKSGNPDSAVNILAPLDAPEARLLQTYARLQNHSLSAEQVIENSKAYLDDQRYQGLHKPILSIMIEAAQTDAMNLHKADFIEQYLLVPETFVSALHNVLPEFAVADLVSAYSDIATARANSAGYLVGEESGWSEFAKDIDPQATVIRRAVWAHISMQVSADSVASQLAIDNYINALIDGDRVPLAGMIFGENLPLGQLLLSPQVGLRLFNVAIEADDVQLAADANANVLYPPAGTAMAEWLLYTGRISIIAGRYQKGATQLDRWISAFEKLTPAQTDKVLQAVFDLQTVNQHALAIPLLQKINQRSPTIKYRREIAFWIAESYDATGQYIKAANYFLFSAMQKANGFDQWGEAARYRAAESLLQGNLFVDAKTLFEGLEKRAADESRRQALDQKLQQLRLRQSSIQPVKTDTGSGAN